MAQGHTPGEGGISTSHQLWEALEAPHCLTSCSRSEATEAKKHLAEPSSPVHHTVCRLFLESCSYSEKRMPHPHLQGTGVGRQLEGCCSLQEASTAAVAALFLNHWVNWAEWIYPIHARGLFSVLHPTETYQASAVCTAVCCVWTRGNGKEDPQRSFFRWSKGKLRPREMK